jgi:hypothetical protein
MEAGTRSGRARVLRTLVPSVLVRVAPPLLTSPHRVATAAAEGARERALSLRSAPPAVPLLRTLAKVRSDVAFLGRAVAFEPRQVEVTTSEALARHAARHAPSVAPADIRRTRDGSLARCRSSDWLTINTRSYHSSR